MGTVTQTVHGHVATITIENEGRFNAMSLSMWKELEKLLDVSKNDKSIRVVVLQGKGDRAFVSGADISEFNEQRSDLAGVKNYDLAVDHAQSALSEFPKPVIAAISGVCYGGGLGLALACDLRYGSSTAKFRMPAARLGLGYALKGMQQMVDIVGVSHASEMFYTASVYDANDALRIGLLNSVTEDVFEHVLQTATLIASNAPLTIAAGKMALQAVRSQATQVRAADVARAVQVCFESDDYVEGRLAFTEKRPACFTGR
jgi:enoyl-CoA hydratase/carnithine racemase